MSKKKKNLENEEVKEQENINSEEKTNEEAEVKEEIKNEELNSETSLDEIEPELEESEVYKKASFKEKVSLKFRKKWLASKLHTLILIVLLVAIFIGLNAWADQMNLAQIDVTKNKLYSLTDTSKDQLKNLDKEIMIYVYGYSKNDDLVQFLQQYNAFNKNIKNEIINESTHYDLVSKYSLGTYSALIVTCGEKDKIIYPDMEFTDYSSDGDEVSLAEESITNAILKVSTDDPVKVYFATGNSGGYSKDTLSSLVTYLEYQVYETEDLNLLTVTEIPSDCDILAIMGPKEDISEEQAEMIINYANNGGNLLVCAIQPDDGEFVNLQKVLDLYGVKINKGLLYEGDTSRYVASRNAPNLNYVLIPGYSQSNPITEQFSEARGETIIMPWSQGLTINEVTEENVSVESSEIVMTSSKCYNLEDYQSGVNLDNLEPSTYTIGSELTRKVTNGDDTTESKLVVYGNATFFTDSYNNSLIQIYVMQNNGNVNLALNTFAELAEEENLLTIRKATNVLTFQNTESEDRIVKVIIFGIPVLIIIIGIIVWNYRRKKR